MKLILGSKSPRRSELLNMAAINFEIRVVDTDESFPDSMHVYDAPEFIAKQKADAIQIANDEVLLTCDTVVIIDKKIFGKPIDESDAINMLQQLSGRKHEVVSGVCIRTLQNEITFSELTEVFFHPLTDEQIKYYISHYKPFDKAGSYAIQEWIGAVGIQKIVGDYFNVMGLPISRVIIELKKFGITISKQ